jgi:hypothetical protein
MALMASADFRGTDITTYIPITTLAAGIALPLSTAGGVKVWQAPAACKILAMKVVSGTATVGGVTYTAAYDTASLTGTTVLPTTALSTALATTAVTAVASTVNVCPIDVSALDNLPPTIPAGSMVGFNIPSTATNASSVCGVQITYRFV